MNAKQLGDVIQFYRQQANMTQAELAKKLGYSSHSIIAKYESGKNYAPYTTLYEMAEIFGVDPAVFFKKSEEDLLILDLFHKCGIDKNDINLLSQQDYEKIFYFISGLIAAHK